MAANSASDTDISPKDGSILDEEQQAYRAALQFGSLPHAPRVLKADVESMHSSHDTLIQDAAGDDDDQDIQDGEDEGESSSDSDEASTGSAGDQGSTRPAMSAQPWAQGLERLDEYARQYPDDMFLAAASECIQKKDAGSHSPARSIDHVYKDGRYQIALLLYTAPMEAATRFFQPKWHKSQGNSKNKPYELYSELAACETYGSQETKYSARAGTHRFEIPATLLKLADDIIIAGHREIRHALAEAALIRAKEGDYAHFKPVKLLQEMRTQFHSIDDRIFVDVIWSSTAPPIDDLCVNVKGQQIAWKGHGSMLHPAVQIVDLYIRECIPVEQLLHHINKAFRCAFVLDVWHLRTVHDSNKGLSKPRTAKGGRKLRACPAFGDYRVVMLFLDNPRGWPGASATDRYEEDDDVFPRHVCFEGIGHVSLSYSGRAKWCNECQANVSQYHKQFSCAPRLDWSTMTDAL